MATKQNKLSIIEAAGCLQDSVTLDMAELHPQYEGVTVEVWVTLTRSHKEWWIANNKWREAQIAEGRESRDQMPEGPERDAYDVARAEEIRQGYNERMVKWLAVTWLDWEEEHVRELYRLLDEKNPMAWEWLIQQTAFAIGAYRDARIKN